MRDSRLNNTMCINYHPNMMFSVSMPNYPLLIKNVLLLSLFCKYKIIDINDILNMNNFDFSAGIDTERKVNLKITKDEQVNGKIENNGNVKIQMAKNLKQSKEFAACNLTV